MHSRCACLVAGEVYDGLSSPRKPQLHTGQRPVRSKLHGRERRVPAGIVHRSRAHAVRHRVLRAHVANVPADAPSPPDSESPQPGGRKCAPAPVRHGVAQGDQVQAGDFVLHVWRVRLESSVVPARR